MTIPPLAPLQAPLAEWAARCPDQWLAEQLRECAALGGSWRNAVGAGMLARLQEPPAGAGQIVARLLPEPSAMHLPPSLSWASELQPDQITTLHDLCLASVDQITAGLDELERATTPAEHDWVATLHGVCLKRDDLECARIILAEIDKADRIVFAVRDLDWRGRRFVQTLPRMISLTDERLWRARLGNPMAWWTELAEPTGRRSFAGATPIATASREARKKEMEG